MENMPCTYRLSIKALIKDDDGRILLIREKNGLWELPGGGLEQGEQALEALGRELKEEIGATLLWMADRPSAFWTVQQKGRSPHLSWFAFIAYEAKIDSIDLNGNEEADEYRFVSHEEMKQLPLHVNQRPFAASL